MSMAIRNTVRNAHEFVRWAARAEPGQPVTYHIGNLARDRSESTALHDLAETVMIFSEVGYVATSQHLMLSCSALCQLKPTAPGTQHG